MPLGGFGKRSWWRLWGVALAGEVLGSALLVALSCASLQPGYALLQPALASGAAVAWLAVALAPVSGGHLNPAVSLAALLAGRMAPGRAAAYCAAQLAGAVLGFGTLVALGVQPAPLGCSAPRVSPGVAVVLEALLTAALAGHCLALWAQHDPARPDAAVGIKLGFTVVGLVCSGGPLTGASFNPARSLAPALFHGCWDHHWVYWVGPLGGSALAALVYRAGVLLAPPPPAPRAAAAVPAADETLPLAEKHEPC